MSQTPLYLQILLSTNSKSFEDPISSINHGSSERTVITELAVAGQSTMDNLDPDSCFYFDIIATRT